MNLTDLLRDLAIEHRSEGEHRHATRNWVQVQCPGCDGGDPDGFHLGIHLSGRYANCWRCGPARVGLTLSDLSGEPLGAILTLLEGVGGGHDDGPAERPVGKLTLPPDVGLMEAPHLRFLHDRGFNPARIQKLWGVRGIGKFGGHNAWRLFIPVVVGGKVVSWVTRAVHDKAQPRYRSAPAACEAVSAKDVLYGADYARHAVIVVEGPLDAWAVGPGAVATLGIGFSEKQIATLGGFPRRVLCLDSDLFGRGAADRLARDLAPFPGETLVVTLQSGKDPSRCDREELKELRRLIK